MDIYKTKSKKIPGSNYPEVKKNALIFYQEIKSGTKRKPYVRSAYFNKDKIFLDLFWAHVFEKNFWDQIRRMKLLPCALELIKKSKTKPVSKFNPNKPGAVLHRFTGLTSGGEQFYIQIKETRNGNKYLLSVFPEQK